MSNSIITFERAFVKLAGDLAVDGYRSPSGEFRVGMASASAAIGYDKNWVGRIISRNKQTSEELIGLGFTGKQINGFVKGQTGLQPVKTISFDDFKILIDFACREGKEKALLLKGIPVKNKIKKSTPEQKVRDKLAELLSGETEIFCPAGRIDILTKKEIIEVKESRKWKSAIGQIIVYGSYYPSHSKRIHLFGQIDQETKRIIEDQARSLNISVTWENNK